MQMTAAHCARLKARRIARATGEDGYASRLPRVKAIVRGKGCDRRFPGAHS